MSPVSEFHWSDILRRSLTVYVTILLHAELMIWISKTKAFLPKEQETSLSDVPRRVHSIQWRMLLKIKENFPAYKLGNSFDLFTYFVHLFQHTFQMTLHLQCFPVFFSFPTANRKSSLVSGYRPGENLLPARKKKQIHFQ